MDRSQVLCAVITVSDGVTRGTRVDTGGSLAVQLLEDIGFSIARRAVIPDEQDVISDTLTSCCDEDSVHLVVTTGGTGLSPRDVTPQATLAVCDYEVPGMAEAMRRVGLESTPYSMLSRQVVAVRGTTLIVNLPGSPNGVREGLQAVSSVLLHGIELLQGYRPH